MPIRLVKIPDIYVLKSGFERLAPEVTNRLDAVSRYGNVDPSKKAPRLHDALENGVRAYLKPITDRALAHIRAGVRANNPAAILMAWPYIDWAQGGVRVFPSSDWDEAVDAAWPARTALVNNPSALAAFHADGGSIVYYGSLLDGRMFEGAGALKRGVRDAGSRMGSDPFYMFERHGSDVIDVPFHWKPDDPSPITLACLVRIAVVKRKDGDLFQVLLYPLISLKNGSWFSLQNHGHGGATATPADNGCVSIQRGRDPLGLFALDVPISVYCPVGVGSAKALQQGYEPRLVVQALVAAGYKPMVSPPKGDHGPRAYAMGGGYDKSVRYIRQPAGPRKDDEQGGA